MNKFKTLAILVALFVALTGAGCKSAAQSFFKSKAKKEVATEVAGQAVERVARSTYDNSHDNNYQYSNNSSNNIASTKNPGKSPVTKAGAVVAGAAAATAGSVAASEKTNPKSSDDIASNKHWIKDSSTSIYLWNPEPTEGESVSWSGGYIENGKYKYADGKGTVTWYKNGKIIQVDNGTFICGRHHGRFIHKFPSGKEMYSNWNNGVEIKN